MHYKNFKNAYKIPKKYSLKCILTPINALKYAFIVFNKSFVF